MKSEHRHELQTNDLSRLTAKTVPFFEQHGNKIIIGICAVLLASALGIWLTRATSAGDVAAWSALSTARDAEGLENVADQYAGTAAADWALLRAAELHLDDGLRAAFRDHTAAETDLKTAREQLETLLNRGSAAPATARERALFAMARLLETTSGSDTQPAITAYGRLLKEFPNSVYQPVAAKRIEQLETGSAQQFYAWFQQQRPTPPDRNAPSDVSLPTTSGGLNLENLLNSGASLPSNDTPDTKPDTSATPTGGPSLGVPPAPTDTPADAPAATADDASPSDDAAAPADKPAATTDEQPAPASDVQGKGTPEPPAPSLP